MLVPKRGPMESQGSALGSNIDSNEDLIGSAAASDQYIKHCSMLILVIILIVLNLYTVS